MKWIGQSIVDFIARFRSDVYLDDPTAGGSDPDKFLGIDSNNKVIYRTGAEVLSDIGVAALISAEDLDVTSDSGTIDVDLNSETLTISGGSGIDTSATGTTVTIAGEDASTSNKGVASFNSNHFSTSSGAASLATAMTWADTTITTDKIKITSTNADDPLIVLSNDADDDTPPRLRFRKGRDADGQDDDGIGLIEFYSYDDGTPSFEIYSEIRATIHDATSGQESGRLAFGVANHNGAMGDGLILTGGSLAGEIDTTIGLGTASVTTVAGDLAVTSDTIMSGALQARNRTIGLSGGTDGAYDGGDVVYFGGTTSMTIGKIYHYKSDGTWEIVNADAVATSDGLLGVALGTRSDTDGMLLRGMVTLDHDPGAIGDVLYVQSDNAGTPGNATATAPSASGDCVRVIGYQVNHASQGEIWFNPDNTFVEVA